MGDRPPGGGGERAARPRRPREAAPQPRDLDGLITDPLPATWALDLDGVVWLGDDDIAGVAEAVAILERVADVIFVTNSAARTPEGVVTKLAAHGVRSHPEQIVTAALSAASMVEPGARTFIIGEVGIREALADRGVEEVDGDDPTMVEAVVVGIDHQVAYEDLARAVLAVRAGARFVVANDDPAYPTPRGLMPGCGAIAAAIAVGADTRPIVAGKGHRVMADYVRARHPGGGIVVGDRPGTDGALAVDLGWQFALVLTGVIGPGDLPVEPTPDVVSDSLATLVAGHPATQ